MTTIKTALDQNTANVVPFTARSNLPRSNVQEALDYLAGLIDGLTIGSDVQAWSAILDDISGLTQAANKGIYFDSATTAATFDLSAFALTVLDDATAGDVLTTLGVTAFAQTILDDTDEATFKATVNLEIGTDVQAYSANLDSWSAVNESAYYNSTETDSAIAAYAQPLDAELSAIAGLVSTADRLPYFTGSGTAALATFTSFSRQILDDTDAATARTTLDVDQAGTDNSTNVTLAGSYDYLSLSGQQITLGQIDLTTDVTGALPVGNVATSVKTADILFVIDGGGSAITTGVKGYLEIPFGCTITQATALADQTGSIVVDVWKDTYANYPPTDADSITASAPVTISSATKSQDSTLTGWTTSITAGDVLGFNVDSITTCTLVTIALKVTKT